MIDTSGVIYSLVCPKTGLVRYIGQTKQLNPIKRYYQHKYQWQRSTKLSHVNSWFKSLYNENLFPKFEILEDGIDVNRLNIAEKEYIKLFKSIGADLTNIEEGGKGDHERFTQKEEWKSKRLETLKTSEKWKARGKIQSEIMKKRHSDGIHKIGFKYLTQDQLKECYKRAAISNGQKVCSIDDYNNIIKEFSSVKEAAEFYNIKSPSQIGSACAGKRRCKTAGGYKWRYSETCNDYR